jgi:hypothetical protein
MSETKEELERLYNDYFESAERANRVALPFEAWLLHYKAQQRRD